MSDAETPEFKVIPAATVVIFRNCPAGGPPELLMVQRSKEMRFAGGAAVFPGGRIDPADRELAQRLAPKGDPLVTAARIAGIRETLEETGLAIALRGPVSASEAVDARALLLETGALLPVLERFGWELDLERLVPFAHWCPQVDGAFNTRFFLANLCTGAVDIAVDATENTRLFWASAQRVLELSATREVSVIFPTRRNLERLALFASFDAVCAHAAQFPIRMIWAAREQRDGKDWLVIPEGHGYPVTAELMSSVMRG